MKPEREQRPFATRRAAATGRRRKPRHKERTRRLSTRRPPDTCVYSAGPQPSRKRSRTSVQFLTWHQRLAGLSSPLYSLTALAASGALCGHWSRDRSDARGHIPKMLRKSNSPRFAGVRTGLFAALAAPHFLPASRQRRRQVVATVNGQDDHRTRSDARRSRNR